eukprot:TRINITY_DN12295_c0_g1_i2.p1 TRINITY_DN12295_c0_g1~~TRINITY_DN12295_c0_g1_i2.p1  ORF type:complete len:649 (+),score=132.20 TRINITY_DN12295_c0_g1_i2:119-2065(+)
MQERLKLNLTDVDLLAGLPATTLLDATQFYWPYPWPDTDVQSMFAPCIDGVELSQHPSALAAAGALPADVSIILGSNRDEGTDFVCDTNYSHRRGHYSGASLPRSLTKAQFQDWSMGNFGGVVGRMLINESLYSITCNLDPAEYELCPIGTYPSWWWAASRATGDSMMTCPSRRAGLAWTNHSNRAYNYYFAHTPVYSVNTYPTQLYGAFHGSEVPFVWHDTFELTGPAELALSSSMVAYWTNFAKHGDPSGAFEAQPTWPAIASTGPVPMMRFATKRFVPYTSDFTERNITAIPGLRDRECAFWAAVQDLVVNPIPPQHTAHETVPRAPQPEELQTPAHWVQEPRPMPTPTAQFVAVSTALGVLCVGGVQLDQQGHWRDSASVQVLHRGEWHAEAPLLAPRSGHAAATIDGVVYVVGGKASKSTLEFSVHHSMEAFDSAAPSAGWTSRAPLPQPRTEIAAAVLSGRLYVLGGQGPSIEQDAHSVWSYSPASDQWRVETGLSTPRSGLCAAVLGSSLVALGGFRAGSGASFYDTDPLGSVERLTGSVWSNTAALHTPRHSAAAVTVPGAGVVVVGGRRAQDLDLVELLHPNGTWGALPSLPSARSMGGAVWHEGCVYAIGGLGASEGSAFVGTVDKLCVSRLGLAKQQ